MKRKWALRQEISWVIAAKILLLAALFTLFFAPSKRPKIDADAVSRHLLSNPRGNAP
jgi:hypothetical protein